jgi:hypothetical protein
MCSKLIGKTSFGNSPQVFDPVDLSFTIRKKAPRYFARVTIQIKVLFDGGELFQSGSQKRLSRLEDAQACVGPKDLKHAHPKPEFIGVARILLSEVAQPQKQFFFAESSQGIQLSRLASLSWNFLLAHPFTGYKPPQQWIHKIVVKVLLAKDQPCLPLKRIPVLGTVQQGSQDY